MKFDNTLMQCVKQDLNANLIPMLLGEPGIGKSSWLENLAILMHTKCFTLACNQLADKADLTGARLVPIQDKQGNTVDYKQVFYPHAVIHDAIEYANENPRETPILFLDELNRTTPDVTSEALSIPTMRQIGSKHLPKNLRVVIAGNDKGNVTSLDDASVSRFVLYHVEPDVATFLEVNPELNEFVKNVLEAHPEVLFGKHVFDSKTKDDDDDGDDDNVDEIDTDMFDESEQMLQMTTPRTVSAVSAWLNAIKKDDLIAMLGQTTKNSSGDQVSVLEEVIEGHVGHTLFSAYLLKEINENITNIDQTSSSLIVGKPDSYDNLKKATSHDELVEKINNLSKSEQSGCLVYALFEPEDNSSIIEALASTMSNNKVSITATDSKTLMKLSADNKLDQQNVEVFLQTDTPISEKLAIILETN